ncbi:hypothetical protein BC828DRAFT_431501 [Blastocladiella britannica]|nr:hypothetical protein BC828DRAFT_431501 [Blastocladiella britannica]
MRAHAHSPPVPMPTPLAAPVPLGMRSSDAAYYPQPGAADGHQDWPLQLQQQHQYTHQYAHQHHPQAFFQHQHYAYPLADGPMSPFSGASSSAASSAASSGRDWSHSPSPPVLGVSGGAVGAVDSPFPSPYAPTIAPSAEADYALPPVGALRVSDWPPPPHRRPTSPGSTLNAAVPVATASAAGNGMPPRASPRMYHPYQLPIQSAAAAPVASPTYLPDPRSLSGMPTPRLVRPLPLTSASAGGSGSFTGSISSPTFSWPLQSPQRAATNKASWTPPSPRPRGRSSSSMSMPELTTRAAPPPLPTATAAAGADAALSLPPLWSVVRPDQDPMRGPAPPLPPPATPRPSRSLPSFQHLLAPSSIAAPVVGGSVAAATPMVDDDVWLGAPPGDAPPPQQPAHWFAPRH